MSLSFFVSKFRNARDNLVTGNISVSWEGFCKRLERFAVLADKKSGEAFCPVAFLENLDGYHKTELIYGDERKPPKGFLQTSYEYHADGSPSHRLLVNQETGEEIRINQIPHQQKWSNGAEEAVTDLDGRILRHDVNVRAVYMAVLDYDHIQATPEEFLKPWAEFNYLLHSTFSHNPPENQSYRLIVPLKKPLSATEFKIVWPELSRMSGNLVDPTCKNLSRIWFLPACPAERQERKVLLAVQDRKFLAMNPKVVEKATKTAAKEAAKPVIKSRGDYKSLNAVLWFTSHGHYLGVADKPNKHFVRCPWQADHTGGKSGPTDTVLYTDPNRWPTFACSHAHCKGRDIRELNALWGDIDSYCAKKMDYEEIRKSIKTEIRIRALGYDETGRYWYQCNQTDAIRKLKGDQHKELMLYTITADVEYWFKNYGTPDGKIDWKRAAADLIHQGNQAGPISPEIRGLGCWMDAGRLVVHLGRSLLVDGQVMPITDIKSQFIYERARLEVPLARQRLPSSEACKVLQLTDRFPIPQRNQRVLLAGMAIAGMISGVLEWRPHMWLTGGPQSGKSSILKYFINRLWSPIGAFSGLGGTTESGIRQKIKNDVVPIIVDETEGLAKGEVSRVNALVVLARSASSADEDFSVFKGTAGGTGLAYTIRSCFLFASVSHALEWAQDKQRFSVVQFQATKDSARNWSALKMDLRKTLTREFAIALYRRAVEMVDIIRDSADMFHQVVMDKIPDAVPRYCDQVGTLLACAWSLLSDTPITREEAWEFYDRLGGWDEARQETQEESVATTALNLLYSHLIIEGATRKAIWEYVQDADNPALLEDSNSPNKILKRFGMFVREGYLYVASNHPQTVRIFKEYGITGHHSILCMLEGSERTGPQRYGGSTHRGVRIPIQQSTKGETDDVAVVKSVESETKTSPLEDIDPFLF